MNNNIDVLFEKIGSIIAVYFSAKFHTEYERNDGVQRTLYKLFKSVNRVMEIYERDDLEGVKKYSYKAAHNVYLDMCKENEQKDIIHHEEGFTSYRPNRKYLKNKSAINSKEENYSVGFSSRNNLHITDIPGEENDTSIVRIKYNILEKAYKKLKRDYPKIGRMVEARYKYGKKIKEIAYLECLSESMVRKYLKMGEEKLINYGKEETRKGRYCSYKDM